MRWSRIMSLVLACLLLLLSALATRAQEATPNPNAPVGERPAASTDRLDLAAIVLPSDAMPEGYALSFEVYVSGAEIAEQLMGGAVEASAVERTGLGWYYESRYQSADGETRIRSYAEEYASASGAEAGFALLEDESVFVSPGRASVDKPGFDIGETPSEITVSTVDATNDTPSSATIDFTFRVGRLLGGVAIDTVSTVQPDEALIEELAGTLAERMQAVLDGDDVAGIDSSLPGSVVSFEGGVSVQEGYVSAPDVIAADVPAGVSDGFESGYVRVVALGDASGDVLPLPVVSLAVSAYDSERGPLAALTNADAVTPDYPQITRASIDRVAGVSATVAFSYANAFSNSPSVDSIRIMAVIGDKLVTVEVAGAPDLDAARETAVALVTQQVACVTSDASCGVAQFPDSLGIPKG